MNALAFIQKWRRAHLRGRLDRFEGRDPNAHWAWFVQSTCKVGKHDFRVLTRQ